MIETVVQQLENPMQGAVAASKQAIIIICICITLETTNHFNALSKRMTKRILSLQKLCFFFWCHENMFMDKLKR